MVSLSAWHYRVCHDSLSTPPSSPSLPLPRYLPFSGQYGSQMSHSSIDAMASPSAEIRGPNAPSRSSRLLLQNHASQENRYPEHDELHDSANTSGRGTPTRGGLELPRMVEKASLVGSSARMGFSEGSEAAARIGGDAVAATSAAGISGRKATQQGGSSFPPEGSPLVRPTARSRPLASTPMPSINPTPSSNRRSQRAVAQPVTYEEPSLKFKMRK